MTCDQHKWITHSEQRSCRKCQQLEENFSSITVFKTHFISKSFTDTEQFHFCFPVSAVAAHKLVANVPFPLAQLFFHSQCFDDTTGVGFWSWLVHPILPSWMTKSTECWRGRKISQPDEMMTHNQKAFLEPEWRRNRFLLLLRGS